MIFRKLNRPDIVIKGLPNGLKNLPNVIIDIGKHYNTTFTIRDIDNVNYINNGNAILVKFTSALLRDVIMGEYFKSVKTEPLMLSHIILDPAAVNLNKRVFLNDHFPPATGKLNALCAKLRKDNKIIKYKIKNADKPIAVLTLPN